MGVCWVTLPHPEVLTAVSPHVAEFRPSLLVNKNKQNHTNAYRVVQICRNIFSISRADNHITLVDPEDPDVDNSSGPEVSLGTLVRGGVPLRRGRVQQIDPQGFSWAQDCCKTPFFSFVSNYIRDRSQIRRSGFQISLLYLPSIDESKKLE